MSKDWKVDTATKHIDTAYHLQRDYVEKKIVSITYLPSSDMVADGITKPQGHEKLLVNCNMYGTVKGVIDGSS